MKHLIVVILAALLGLSGHAKSTVVAPYVRDLATLRVALDALPGGLPLCVASGQGYKCAPVRVELRTMTRDGLRADWWDNHCSPSEPGNECALVLVLAETTRAAIPGAIIGP